MNTRIKTCHIAQRRFRLSDMKGYSLKTDQSLSKGGNVLFILKFVYIQEKGALVFMT